MGKVDVSCHGVGGMVFEMGCPGRHPEEGLFNNA